MSTYREVGPDLTLLDMPTSEDPSLGEGEVLIEDSSRMAVASGVLAQLNASEIDRMIATAKAFPRSITHFREEVTSLVTQDAETAAASIYALPRGKEKNPVTGKWERKIVTGPTARFGEIVAYSWGNNRYGARIIDTAKDAVTAQGVFFDLERNVCVSIEVNRSIVDSDGNRYSQDMINMTANAALSVASRNAILKAVPKALWKGLLQAAEQTIKGTRQTLVERRKAIIDQFKAFAMTEDMVCRVLGVEGLPDIALEHLGVLQGILTSLKDGETTVAQLMADSAGPEAQVAAKGQRTMDKIKAQHREAVTEAQRKLEQRRAAQAKSKPTQAKEINVDAEAPPPGVEMKEW